MLIEAQANLTSSSILATYPIDWYRFSVDGWANFVKEQWSEFLAYFSENIKQSSATLVSKSTLTATAVVQIAFKPVAEPAVDRNTLVGAYAVYGNFQSVISLQFIFERTIYSENKKVRKDIAIKMVDLKSEKYDMLPKLSLEKIANGKGKTYNTQKQRRNVQVPV